MTQLKGDEGPYFYDSHTPNQTEEHWVDFVDYVGKHGVFCSEYVKVAADLDNGSDVSYRFSKRVPVKAIQAAATHIYEGIKVRGIWVKMGTGTDILEIYAW